MSANRWLPLSFILLLLASTASGQDRIVLRDTKVVNGTVTALSPDGIAMNIGGNPTMLGWDEVEAGKVGKQDEFDKLLKKIGDPLFRTRQRLKTGDYRELLEPTDKLFPTFAERNSPVADTICLATAFARLANNQREAAVEPFLCVLANRSRPEFKPDSRFAALNSRNLTPDARSGVWLELPPVWFDSAAAKAALPRVEARLKSWPGGKPTFAANLYAFTLALAAGDADAARRFESSLRESPVAADWVLVVDAQREIEEKRIGEACGRLEAKLDSLPEPVRIIGTYWVGMANLASADAEVRKRGVVWMLHLPAKYATTCPDLAAAGLYFASKALDELKDARGAVTLRGELLIGFRQTYHAAKLTAETAPPKTDRDRP